MNGQQTMNEAFEDIASANADTQARMAAQIAWRERLRKETDRAKALFRKAGDAARWVAAKLGLDRLFAPARGLWGRIVTAGRFVHTAVSTVGVRDLLGAALTTARGRGVLRWALGKTVDVGLKGLTLGVRGLRRLGRPGNWAADKLTAGYMKGFELAGRVWTSKPVEHVRAYSWVPKAASKVAHFWFLARIYLRLIVLYVPARFRIGSAAAVFIATLLFHPGAKDKTEVTVDTKVETVAARGDQVVAKDEGTAKAEPSKDEEPVSVRKTGGDKAATPADVAQAKGNGQPMNGQYGNREQRRAAAKQRGNKNSPLK